MNKIFTYALLLGLVAISACKDAPPETTFDTTEYKNDSYTEGDTNNIIFQAGFTATERAAVVLGPINETFIINEIKFMFGGELDSKDVIVRIYWDEGKANPGEKMYEGTHTISNPSVTSFQTINLRNEEITFHSGGTFRVTLEFKHAGLPCVARDNDGNFSNTKNWVYENSNWIGPDLIGIKDDFIIRATVDTKAK
ncbi:hypothetical protein GYB22_00600 [bacterium]|nr:hypothetical protein [bacterium]